MWLFHVDTDQKDSFSMAGENHFPERVCPKHNRGHGNNWLFLCMKSKTVAIF